MDDHKHQFKKKAYQHIKQKILNLHLKPGEWIDEHQVANEIGASRTPVRDALADLEKEGLVVYKNRKGWFVYSLSIRDVEDIFRLKEVVEGLLAREAANCNNPLLQSTLRMALDSMQNYADKKNWDRFLQADFEFHETIYAMSGNQRAVEFARQLNEQWHRLRISFTLRESRMVKTVPEHMKIAESILTGDGLSAENWMRSHMKSVRDDLMDLLENLVYPFSSVGL